MTRFTIYPASAVVPAGEADTLSGAIEDALTEARHHNREHEVTLGISKTVLAYCHPGGRVRFTSACVRSRRYDDVRAAWHGLGAS